MKTFKIHVYYKQNKSSKEKSIEVQATDIKHAKEIAFQKALISIDSMESLTHLEITSVIDPETETFRPTYISYNSRISGSGSVSEVTNNEEPQEQHIDDNQDPQLLIDNTPESRSYNAYRSPKTYKNAPTEIQSAYNFFYPEVVNIPYDQLPEKELSDTETLNQNLKKILMDKSLSVKEKAQALNLKTLNKKSK